MVKIDSPARVEARIKRLCCLGLGGEAIMPALLSELHALIPSYSNTFFWADANCELSNIYDECPDSAQIAPLYIAEFYNKRECEVHPGFSHTMRHDFGVIRRERTFTVDQRTFHNSDLYNLILRPIGYDDFLRLMVREGGGRALGALQLFRRGKDASFTPEEERRLARLEPFIAHALEERSAGETSLAESGQTGLVIADRAGRLLYQSPEGRRLLLLATHPTIAPTGLPAALVHVCGDLAMLLEEDGQAAMAPVRRHKNLWGSFTFRAHALNAEAGPSLIGISIEHREPLPLALWRRIEQLPLSGRQAQICLLMARGLSYRGIAEHLGVNVHTAITHGRSVYEKLDVHSRAELVSRLLAT